MKVEAFSAGQGYWKLRLDQVAAIARWSGALVRLHAYDPRTSLIAQIAAKLEPLAIGEVFLDNAFKRSLR